jgi:hypothetical protein
MLNASIILLYNFFSYDFSIFGVFDLGVLN